MSDVGLLILLCFSAALAELVLHWFPWEMLIGGMLPRTVAYCLGVLVFSIPLTIYFLMVDLSNCMPVVALWAHIVSAGLAVLLAYGVDWLMDRSRTVKELQEIIDARRTTEEE